MKLIALMKKEFRRFFHDPRLIITMIVPGLLIFIIYSVLGSAIWSGEEETYDFKAYVSGQSELRAVLEQAAGCTLLEATDLDAARKEVEEGKADALVVFPENFDEAVKDYVPAPDAEAPLITVCYRAADDRSAAFYAIATAVFDAYESSIANKFDIAVKNFSSETEMVTSLMSGLLPFLVVIFIFSACMSVTLESVAGEKERGTLATILITSAKRSHVALGKVIPLSCMSAIGATSSFFGVVLSMPKLMGMSVGSFMGSVGFLNYFLLFLLILSVVPLIVSLVSVVSTYARSVKEASAYTSVIMILTMVLSIVSAFVSGIGDWIVVVPILNAVVCMQGALTGSAMIWQSFVSVGINLVYTALLVFAIARMFSSEKIMFGS
ncbi:MAG: ABC transporter permease [Clostridia bacterium]|nr:ABC transporter permease [Clostridia bacterium]